MNKQLFLMVFVLPNIQAAARWFKTRDDNSSGFDDRLARILEFAALELERFLDGGSEPTESVDESFRRFLEKK